MWPFGRKSGKPAKFKPATEGPHSSSTITVAVAGLNNNNADRKLNSAHSATQSHVLRKSPTRRNSRRKRPSSRSTTTPPSGAMQMQPDPTALERERVHVPFGKPPQSHRDTSVEDITALPQTKRLDQSPHLRPITHGHHVAYNSQPNHSDSQSSLPRKHRKLLRPQSLRNPPARERESTLLGRKSSKRKAYDSVREEEIRAMSMPLPQKRSAGNSHGMLRRESKKVKGGLNWHFHRPTSDISLPHADSIHSSMSGSSESRFRVSTLDMFSPRPKVRCIVGSQHYYASTRESPVSMKDKENVPLQRTNSRGHERRSSRIDDLADTLDAGALRQILERDKRRKEAKRKANDERLRRKLERRAEKQRAAEEWAALHPGEEQRGRSSMSRGEAARAVGLGIQKDVPTPMEDVRPSTPQRSSPRPQHLDLSTPKKSYENAQLPTPMDSPLETPIVADAQAVRLSRASMSMSPTPQRHTRGPSNVSELPALLSELAAQEKPIDTIEAVQDPRASGSLHPVTTVDTNATSKRGSSRRRSSEGGRMAAFASLFRRAKRGPKDQGRTTPSEVSFSNTSRESMARQPLPPHLTPKKPLQPIAVKRPARPPSVPRRTMSKFREDLPESRSPPESRMQSPDVVPSSAIASRRQSQPLSELHVGSESTATEARTDSPVSPGVPATGLMSQSLASVDSEGSWLSGKPMKRRSNTNAYVRSSVGSSSAAAKRTDEFNASYEELGIPDDEYLRRLTPQPDERRGSANSNDYGNRKASSTAMAGAVDTAPEAGDEAGHPAAASNSTADEQLVQTGVARQPTIIHRQPRVKSTEGLLSFYHPDTASPEETQTSTAGADPILPDSPTSDPESPILQRAQSVNLGKRHSRQLSAGSAKLLDIKARRTSGAGDPRRSSAGARGVVHMAEL